VRRSLALVVSLLLVLAVSCGDDETGDGSGITVFAAASLADAFDEVGSAFTQATGVEVTFSFDASSALVQQIVQGAPADVVASADTTTMARLHDGGLIDGEPVVFATNHLALLVAGGNPLGIERLADLAARDIRVVVCAEQVPCGRYAHELLERAGVALTPASLEQHARGVVTKVAAGEADAGIAYATDGRGAEVEVVALPAELDVVAPYPAAVVAGAAPAAAAHEFVAFLTSDAGRAILADHGFGPA